MELIVINQRHLKIMLTEEDMIFYGIENEEKTEGALLRILEEAKIKTGFDTKGKRLTVESYPCKKGGCEMFVFAEGEEKETESLRPLYFSFGSPKALAFAMYALSPKEKPKIYTYNEKGCFFAEFNAEKEEKLRISSVLSEFGEEISPDTALPLICERCEEL